MLANLHSSLKRLTRLGSAADAPVAAPVPGLYHFERRADGWENCRSRVHLRIEPGEGETLRGILMVNASRLLHLNASATFMAYLALQQTSKPDAIRALREAFNVPARQADLDYTQFVEQLDKLISPDGPCPIHDLDLEVAAPFSARPTAPYRMDLALTYRCNNDCAHCYNARPRQYPELSTREWIEILDLLWSVGIPHVVFTGGEPTLREDLPELVAHAEQNGQITGLNTNGRRLSDRDYLQRLIDAGLDHVQITLESHEPMIHDEMVSCRGAWKQTIAGLHNCLNSRLYVMTNTTMLRQNSPTLADTLDFLAASGVPTIGLNALIYSGHGLTAGTGLQEKELEPLLVLARSRTEAAGQRLIWYTPTQYCHFDPMQLELGVKGCTAALYNMCIEPDGSVLPCQSYYHSLGRLPGDTWESIWNHDLSIAIRERRYIPAKCEGCALLTECGGGCPLALQAGALSQPSGLQMDVNLD